MYSATSGLSHQGTDQSKALLEFRNGKALRDSDGVKWFLVNGANKFGFDKVSFSDRVKFIRSRETEWSAIADDPLGNRGWAEAEKPYQFLAWCIEFGAFIELSPGQDRLCHISELDTEYVRSVGDVVKLGEVVRVKVIAVDDQGRVKLSRKAVMLEEDTVAADA